MTTHTETVTLTFTERVQVAIGRLGGRSRAANYFGIDPSTVTRWTRGTTVPPLMTVRALALASDIPFEWLRPSPDEIEEGRASYTPRDSNPEPTD